MRADDPAPRLTDVRLRTARAHGTWRTPSNANGPLRTAVRSQISCTAAIHGNVRSATHSGRRALAAPMVPWRLAWLFEATANLRRDLCCSLPSPYSQPEASRSGQNARLDSRWASGGPRWQLLRHAWGSVRIHPAAFYGADDELKVKTAAMTGRNTVTTCVDSR